MASKTDAGDNSSSANNGELNTFDLYTGSKDNTNLLNLCHEVNIKIPETTWKEQLESPWVEATIKTSKGNKNSILNKFSDHEREENSSRADADKASTSKCDTL